jgi:beta-glucosidase
MTSDQETDRAAAGSASSATARPALAAKAERPLAFPKGFLWGTATAGHQTEGQNVNSDIWLLEHIKPSTYKEPSGDACNSFYLWREDLDIVRQLNLNSYRFSIEWARIEPEEGQFSLAMLDHYRHVIAGCRERGLRPMVTFNHWAAPRWFAARGGWLNPNAPDHFARYCEYASRYLGADIDTAVTLNEPNMMQMLDSFNFPSPVLDARRGMLAAAAASLGTPRLAVANAVNKEDLEAVQAILIAAHRMGYAAIKNICPAMPVGVTLTMTDDQSASTDHTHRDAKRAKVYGAWLDAAKGHADFLGVQNYERTVYDQAGPVPPGKDAPLSAMGAEIYPASLAGAVRYAHAACGLPIIVTEHGVCTDDDAQRAAMIAPSLAGLHAAIQDGVPVRGYFHWSLLDNFEWIFGYAKHYGLVSVDRTTFKRTIKPSAAVLSDMAERNAISPPHRGHAA